MQVSNIETTNPTSATCKHKGCPIAVATGVTEKDVLLTFQVSQPEQATFQMHITEDRHALHLPGKPATTLI